METVEVLFAEVTPQPFFRMIRAVATNHLRALHELLPIIRFAVCFTSRKVM